MQTSFFHSKPSKLLYILTFLTNKNMTLLEMKTVTITDKGQIAIPKDIRKIEGFK